MWHFRVDFLTLNPMENNKNVFAKMEDSNIGGGAESSSPLRYTSDEFEGKRGEPQKKGTILSQKISKSLENLISSET